MFVRLGAFFLGLVLATLPAWAQQNEPPLPVLTYVLTQVGTASLSTTTTSSRVSLGSAASTIYITNTGNVPVCIALGDVTVVANGVSCPTSILPGLTRGFGMTSNTYLAGITQSGTSSLAITTGYLTPAPNGGGPISGTVTANQGTAAATAGAWPVTLVAGGVLISATNPVPISFGTSVALPAGTNLLGKVGIDQTTPGTTNGVQINAALPAGTATVGKVGIDQTAPGTTNGITITPSSAAAVGIAPVASGAAESNHVLKASAGNLYGLTAAIGATSGYVMLFDATSAPVDGAVTPKYCFPVSSNGTNGGIAIGWKSPPAAFATGITAVFSSTGCFTKTASATASFFAQAQ